MVKLLTAFIFSLQETKKKKKKHTKHKTILHAALRAASFPRGVGLYWVLLVWLQEPAVWSTCINDTMPK